VEEAKTIQDPLGLVGAEFDAVPGIELKGLRVNGQEVPDAPYSFTGLQDGLNNRSIAIDYGPDSSNQISGTLTGNLRIYEQPYSMVIGTVYTHDSGNLMDEEDDLNVHEVAAVMGLETTSATIANLAITATYTGAAFNATQQGLLSYTMNFASGWGFGSIVGLAQSGQVDLNAAQVMGNMIAGKATVAVAPGADVDYYLNFYGPNAEEIAGVVRTVDPNLEGASEIGFGGKR